MDDLDFTDDLEGSKYPTAGLCAFYVNSFLSTDFDPKERPEWQSKAVPSWLKDLYGVFFSELMHRWVTGKSGMPNELILAAYVDPRVCRMDWLEESSRQSAKDFVRDHLELGLETYVDNAVNEYNQCKGKSAPILEAGDFVVDDPDMIYMICVCMQADA